MKITSNLGIEINGESDINEIAHKISSEGEFIIVDITCLGSENNYPYSFLIGSKFMIKLPFCEPVEMTLKKFHANSEVDEPTKVYLKFLK